MKLLRRMMDQMGKSFEKGKPLSKVEPLYEALDTFMFTPGKVNKGTTHVRDGMDLKRLMMTVVWALVPAILMAMYNTGFQANLAISNGAEALDNWRTALVLGVFGGFDAGNILSCFFHGFLYYFPVLVVTFGVGGFWEVLFASVKKHEINEGFLVTGMLVPMIVPPALPLWQLALAISFGVVLGKEVFGGVGMNIFNPALVTRAFLFFAYPAAISGDSAWIAARNLGPDTYSGATWLTTATNGGLQAIGEAGYSWMDAFLGFIPGSMGETSALACLIGAAILIVTRVASWRTMAGVVGGALLMSLVLNGIGSDTNLGFSIPFYWHFVLGGFAFGAVFMATDPVSSAYTKQGQLIYGFFIGLLAVLIRVINPAYPEGMMLAILFMNMFAPLIDYVYIRGNIKRRKIRNAAG